MLHEHYSKYSNSIGVLLKDVQFTVAGDAGVRTPLGNCVGRGVMTRSAANNPEAYQRVEDWSRGEMGFPINEAYSLPVNTKSLVGSVMANMCGSHYQLHMAMVEVSSQRILIGKAFSVPKYVRLARMSLHWHRLSRKILGTVPGEQRDNLSEILGEEVLSLEGEKTSDFESQNMIGKPTSSTPALEENDVTHEKMMEVETLLEASGERNLRSIKLTHGECPLPLRGSNGVVSGAIKSLSNMGRGRN